jgi:bacterioferritin-associated ferredoxin
MIVCVCKAINDRAIRRAVAEGHDTFDALQFELGVGTCCGKCVASACEVLCEARAEALDVEPSHRTRTTQQPVHFVQRSPTREIALA